MDISSSIHEMKRDSKLHDEYKSVGREMREARSEIREARLTYMS